MPNEKDYMDTGIYQVSQVWRGGKLVDGDTIRDVSSEVLAPGQKREKEHAIGMAFIGIILGIVVALSV